MQENNLIKRFFAFISRNEPVIFFIILLLNLWPVFVSKYFSTNDGGAHCYNVNILYSLLFDADSVYEQYFVLNPEPVPNWAGHFFLLLCKPFFPFYQAEKILVAIFLLISPVLFRSIIKKTSSNIAFCYFFFPFSHYNLLYLGFYNFSIGVVVLFLFINFWLKYQEHFRLKHYIIIVFFFVLLYFSHLFVLLIALLFIAMQFLSAIVSGFRKNPGILKEKALQAFYLLICFLPVLLLVINYFMKRSEKAPAQMIFWGAERVLHEIATVHIVVAFSGNEIPSSILLACLLLLLTLFFVFRKFYNRAQLNLSSLFFGNTWVLTAFVLLAMAFFLPDDDGYGAYITPRILFFFFLFLIISLSTTHFPKWLLAVSLMLLGVIHFSLLEKKVGGQLYLEQERKKLDEGFQFIPEGARIGTFVLDNNPNWLGFHFMNYLGAEKEVIIFDNYETDLGYFPLQWNCSVPILSAGPFSFPRRISTHCPRIVNKNQPIDYILVYGKNGDDKEFRNLVREMGPELIQVFCNDVFCIFKHQRGT